MFERCLNETERVLATSKEVVLPIKELWKLVAAEGKRRSFDVPPLTDFDALLEGDGRFEVLSAQKEPDEAEPLVSEDGEEIDANLGTLGFYPEDRVKLRRLRLPGEGPHAKAPVGTAEDDEDVVPFNVKGLSATKPVHPVEAKKHSPKKGDAKTTRRVRSSSRPPRKKKSANRSGRIRKTAGRPSRKKG